MDNTLKNERVPLTLEYYQPPVPICCIKPRPPPSLPFFRHYEFPIDTPHSTSTATAYLPPKIHPHAPHPIQSTQQSNKCRSNTHTELYHRIPYLFCTMIYTAGSRAYLQENFLSTLMEKSERPRFLKSVLCALGVVFIEYGRCCGVLARKVLRLEVIVTVYTGLVAGARG